MLLTRRILSSGALVLLAVLFVTLVLLSNQVLRGVRVDLTAQSLYTLSQGTRNILGKLDEPVHLTLYFSDKATAESNRAEVRNLRVYFERVRELLEEMRDVADGKLQLEIVDPLPYSETEDRAAAAGIKGLPLGPTGEKIFFGLVGNNATDGQSVIPFFDPNKEAFLEYDITKLTHDLAVTKKPKVGLISGLPISAGFDPQTMAMNQGWASYQQLAQLFEIKTLDAASLKTIPDDVNVLVLVHPKSLNEDAQYAIDQFVLRGGHLLAFVDPNAESDSGGADPRNPMMAMLDSKSSDLPELFKAWGVSYDPKQVVLDREHALKVGMSPDAPPVRHPGIIRLNKNDLPQDDVVSANLNNIIIASPGAFKLATDSPYQLTPLLQTGNQAMSVPVDQVKFNHDPNQLLSNYVASNERYALAVRLQGRFKTAFPNRNEAGHLAEAKRDGMMILVADTDLLTDRYWVQMQNFFGQRLMNSFANNADWFINAVDNLSGSSDLMAIRGRGVSSKPFTLVESLKMAADDRFRIKEQQLQKELNDTERKLVDLQQTKSNDQQLVLSAEQERELDNFLKRKLEIRKELREVRRQLDADIDTLGAWLKFINIGLLPLLLTLGALVFLASQARRKTA